MSIRLNGQEYLWLTCESCKDKCKLAKNMGTLSWKGYGEKGRLWLEEFLLKHSDCDLNIQTTK